MSVHRYQLGDQVLLRPRGNRSPILIEHFIREARIKARTFEITRLMPPDETGFQYRVRGDDGSERVAHEDELQPFD